MCFAGCVSVQLPHLEIKRPVSPESQKTTWLELAGRALEENPDLVSARYAVDSNARSRDITFGDYLPSGTGELLRGRTRTFSSPAEDNMALNLGVDQKLFTGFNTTGQFLEAKKNLEAARWAYQETSAQVRFRVRSAYIDLLEIERLSEVSERIVERRKQNAEMIRLRYEAGREHLGSTMRATAIAEQAAFEVRQNRRRVDSASLRLGREAGGTFQLPIYIEGELEKMIPVLPSNAPEFEPLAEETPQVKRALKEAEAAKAAVIAAQSAVWPQVDGEYDYGSTGTNATNQKKESFLGLRVSVPFFSGGKNVNAIRKAESDYKIAYEAARSVRDETVAQLAEAWQQFADAVEQVEVRRNFLEAARKRSEIVRSEYATGLVNFQDFDITEQDIADSEKNYVSALANALTQEAAWQQIKGETLEDVLREN